MSAEAKSIALWLPVSGEVTTMPYLNGAAESDVRKKKGPAGPFELLVVRRAN